MSLDLVTDPFVFFFPLPSKVLLANTEVEKPGLFCLSCFVTVKLSQPQRSPEKTTAWHFWSLLVCTSEGLWKVLHHSSATDLHRFSWLHSLKERWNQVRHSDPTKQLWRVFKDWRTTFPRMFYLEPHIQAIKELISSVKPHYTTMTGPVDDGTELLYLKASGKGQWE